MAYGRIWSGICSFGSLPLALVLTAGARQTKCYWPFQVHTHYILVGWNHWKFYSRMFEVKQLAVSLSSKCLCCLSKKTRKTNKNNYATFRKRATCRSRGARRVQNTVHLHSSSCWQPNNGNETSAAVANGQHTWTTVTKVSAGFLKIPAHSGKRCKRKDG